MRNMTVDEFEAFYARVMSEKRPEPKRIVSYTVYQEAQKAVDAGATHRQIELCLAGAKWDWVKDNTP